jgi:hypothetical protein
MLELFDEAHPGVLIARGADPIDYVEQVDIAIEKKRLEMDEHDEAIRLMHQHPGFGNTIPVVDMSGYMRPLMSEGSLSK